MISPNRKTPEQRARDYCLGLGLNPNEAVIGRDNSRGIKAFIRLPRWRWYLGVSEEGLKRPI